MTRVDGTVNFDWGTGSPAAGIPVDHFSGRWTGQVNPRYSETYTFCVTSNDGTRLWVNNTLVVDFWHNSSTAVQHCGTIVMQANSKYPIRLEYYENTGKATERLYWSSATQAQQIIPKARLYSH